MITSQAQAARAARTRGEEPEWAVWLTVGVALLLGFALQYLVTTQTQSFSAGEVSLSYPAGWVRTGEEGAELAAADLNRGGPYGPRVSLLQFDKQELVPLQGGLYEAALNWSVQKGEELVGYRVLDIRKSSWKGREAFEVETGYLIDAEVGGATNTMPGLMRSIDTIVEGRERYYVLSFAAENSRFSELHIVRDRLLDGWRVP